MRILFVLGAVALGAAIIWASFVGEPLFTEGAAIAALPWGLVTLIDLYLGFALSIAVIAAVERNVVRALLWAAPVPFLGNVWTAVWFALRWPAIWKRLKPSGDS